ncbi:MAG: hypothetical protein JSW20_00625 [Nitrospiraceae bacterium]|nr:MAG: hypothetical protein JSW20_00625 [Nitrospiraceae bacterium]
MSKKSKKNIKGNVPGKITSHNDTFICFNKECKLRKQKSCKGFEGCPGYLGK